MANYLSVLLLFKFIFLIRFSAQVGSISGDILRAKNLTTISLRRTVRSLPNSQILGGRQTCVDCTNANAGQCTRKNFLKVKKYTEELKCQPETTLVKLNLPGPQYSVEPAVARVHQCSGYCRRSFQTCLPTETAFITVPVILTDHLTRTTKCVEYQVEQHKSCSCGCKILKEHCSERHMHDRCSCKCLNEDEKYKCLNEESFPMIWDDESCECICEPEICPIELQWNPVQCRCEAMSSKSFVDADVDNLLY